MRRSRSRTSRQKDRAERGLKSRCRRVLLEKLEDRRVLATWSGALPGDTTWDNSEVHEIVGDVTVPSGTTLTIDPGAIVKFHSTGTELYVDGMLDAQGTAAENIVFTSISDDVGGDTNNDGDASAPAAGNWPFLQVTGSGTISHAQIRYGGHFHGSMVFANGGSLTISDSIISDSSSDGIRAIGADPTLTNIEYRDNLGAAISMDLNSNPAISGVTVAGNGINGLEVDSGTLAKSLTWNDADIVYWLRDDVLVPDGITLQIDAGQIVKPAHSGVEVIVDGRFTATGTAGSPVVFTSFADDTRGGDTNGDGNGSVAAPGHWGRVQLRDSSSGNSIDHFESHFGGHFVGNSLLAISTDVTISNSTFSDSASDGVHLAGTDAVMTANTFTGNLDAAISMDLDSNPTISGVTISGNHINGLQVHAGTLQRDLVWDDADIVYWLNSDVTVPEGTKLRIDEGQIVKPSHSGVELFVDGSLEITGTAAKPVVFTSFADDTFGGDTNGDGSAATPAPGNWGRIDLRDTSAGNTVDHLQSYFGGHFVGNAFRAAGTDLSISNSTFSGSASDGLRLVDTDAILTDNVFTNNVDAAVSMDLSSNPDISGVTISGNGINGLQVDSGTLAESLIWDDPEIVYRLNDDIVVPTGITLLVEAGQIVKPSHSGVELFVDGTFQVTGTDVSPVVFTSAADDTFGGDTNGDGDASAAAPGQWGRIFLRGDSTGNSIEHLESHYGGHFVGNSLLAIDTDLSIVNSTFTRSASDAVRLQGTDAVMVNNVFRGNLDAAISMDLNSNPAISGVTVIDNRINGLQVSAGTLGKNLVWNDPDIVYWLDDDVVVPNGTSLQIDEGQIVKPAHTGVELIVDGSLQVTGSPQNPAVFTSSADDASGGDTNGDEGGSLPAPGQWGRINLRDESSGNVIEHLEAHYGGHFVGNSLQAANTDLSISNSTISHSASNGLRLVGTDAVVTNSGFFDNAGAAIHMDLNSNPQVTSGGPVVAIGNGINGLVVDGGTVAKDLQWNDPDIVYWISNDIVVPAARKLMIDDGQIVKLAHSGVEIIVDGTIEVDASVDAPAIFTSGSNDLVGGDTNGDADASAPAPGQWGRILLRPGSVGNVIENARLSYGGHFVGEMVFADNAPIVIRDSVLSDSSSDAFAAGEGAVVEMFNNIITGNAQTAIEAASGTQLTAINNTISANGTGVVSNGAASFVELTNNLITFHGIAGVASQAGGAVSLTSNNVFNPGSTNYSGLDDATGIDGNIASDPLYIDPGRRDFQLDEGSPAVDRADGDAASEFDFAGSPRIDDPAVINAGTGAPSFADLGALERDRWFSEIIAPVRSGQIVAGDTLRLLATGNASPRPTLFAWDFGDGRGSSLEAPGLVTFTTVGTQTFSFQAIGADGTSDPEPDTHTITVVADGGVLPDLDVTSIGLPDGLALGQLNQVDYEVANRGDADFPGVTRVDAIYLSTDEFLDANDIQLGSRSVSQPLAVGASYSGSFEVAISDQQLALGINYLIVSVDDHWDVLERRQLNNERALATTAAITQLQSGVATANAFPESGSGHYYQVNVPPGKNLSVFVNGGDDDGVNEIYARFGELPSRGEFDVRYHGIESDPQLVVPAAAPGTWFILAFGNLVPNDGAYTITASVADVQINDVTPERHGDAADAVLTIRGAGFSAGTTVELISTTSTTYSPAEFSIDSFTQMTATFQAGDVPTGIYDVRVSSDGATSNLVDAFEVVAGGEAIFEAEVILPDALGYHQLATIYVEYANRGTVAMDAPLLRLTPKQDGAARAFMTLDQSRLTRGFWTSARPNGFTPSIQVLASGETPGVLQPGESVRIPVYWAGWQRPWDFSYPPFEFELGSLGTDNQEAVDFDVAKEDLRPSTIHPEAWDLVYDNLTNRLGGTWGELIETLDENATYLGRLGQRVLDLDSLLQLEIHAAEGISPIRTLSIDFDAVRLTPGVPLLFGRSYPTLLSERQHLGPFGRGWTHIWDVGLSEGEDGTVTIELPESTTRVFQPDSRGGYFAAPGDEGELRKHGDGTFSLTEHDSTTNTFDQSGRLVSVESASGDHVSASYDSDRLTALEHSSGQRLDLSYNAANRISTITDSLSRQTVFSYDSQNDLLVRVEDHEGRVTMHEYLDDANSPADGSLTVIRRSDGTIETFEYDSQGRLASVRDAEGSEVISLSYPSSGVVEVDSLITGPSRYFYDHHGKLVQFQDPSGNLTQLHFDSGGRLHEFVQPSGSMTEIEHDRDGRVVGITNNLGATTELVRDRTSGALTQLIDAVGHETNYRYDAQGNLTSIVDAHANAMQYTHDASGQISQITNRRGQAIGITLGDDGSLAGLDRADGSNDEYTYDTRGNLISATNTAGTTTLSYNADDRVESITYPGGQSVHYTYDDAGRRASVGDHDGNVANYHYDVLGRLSRVTDGVGVEIVGYTYDTGNLPSRVDHANGVSTTYAYDDEARVIGVVNRGADSSIVSQFDYTYNTLDLIVGATSLDGQWTYKYDASGQLVHALFDSAGGGTDQDIRYDYDAAGNRTRVVRNSAVTDYSTNALNQYESAGNTTYLYDDDGNLIQRNQGGEVTSFQYDDLNRIVSVSSSAGTTTYTYDALGFRIASTTGGVTTHHLIDPVGPGQSLIGQYDAQRDPISRFVYGHGLTSRIDAAGQAESFTFDGIGNTAEVIDAASQITNSYSYAPFGEILNETGGGDNAFTFAGQDGVQQVQVGLYDMQTRFYDADAGRFTQPDSAHLAGGDANMYRYVLNSPVSFNDPSGLSRKPSTTPSSGGIGDHSPEGQIFIVGTGLAVVGATGAVIAIVGTGTAAAVAAPIAVPVAVVGITAAGLAAIDDYSLVKTALTAAGTIAGGAVAGGFTAPAAVGSIGAIGVTAVAGGSGLLGYGIGRAIRLVPGFDDRVQGNIEYWDEKFGGWILWADAPVKPGPRVAGRPTQSKDPNEKVSLNGAGEANFIRDSITVGYRVDFENDPTASAPAQLVTITDPLPAQLDWSTFELTEVGFGDVLIPVPAGTQHFETLVPMTATSGVDIDVEIVVGIRPDSNEVFARFVSLDPASGLPPDVLTGFLPPEDDTGRGQGFFSFVIDQVPGLLTGTEIRNVAEIVFDFGETIATNQVDPHDPLQGTDPAKEALVTIDAGAPTSSVMPLPEAFATAEFVVQWAGEDDAGGSGVASYDIYVSENDGPFELAIAESTATSHEFVGVSGSTYAFISVARDHVGHVEPMPTAADAQTLVIIGAWINQENIYDVDHSGVPTALDALLIINELGRRAVSDPETADLTPLPPAGFEDRDYDVNGDGKCTALDALRVINEMARRNLSSGEQPTSEAYSPAESAMALVGGGASDVELNSPNANQVLTDMSYRSIGLRQEGNPRPFEPAPLTIRDSSEPLEAMIKTLAADVAEQWVSLSVDA